jgi:hypothetical protein
MSTQLPALMGPFLSGNRSYRVIIVPKHASITFIQYTY